MHVHSLNNLAALVALQYVVLGAAIPAGDNKRQSDGACRKTEVAILGAGITGVTIAGALAKRKHNDFVLVEYQNEIGGRVHNAQFGNNTNGKPITVEYGANWAQGIGGEEGHPENPIWTMEKKWNITNHPSNFSRILTYNETGFFNFTSEIDEFEAAMGRMAAEAGVLLQENIQDRNVEQGLSLVGWNPDVRKNPAAADAVEWWLYDGEQAVSPAESSLLFNSAVSNFTFKQFSEDNNFIIDQRGHNTWVKGEASEFLKGDNDDRLLLNTQVTNIAHTPSSVTVTNADGTCIEATYAVCTFSLGVLQRHDSALTFQPPLPDWKRTAIEMFHMGTYTKIFMQFPEKFWPDDTEMFLYADPYQRGWYPIWQTLDLKGFFPGSKVIFVTVTEEQSSRIEKMEDADVQAEAMEVLRSMFPEVEKAGGIPEPEAFLFPRWGETEWAYGSFSSWPAGTTLEQHQNLRANVGGLWFAGEHTSASYFGYMQGALYEGRDVGKRLAGLLEGKCIGDQETGDGDVQEQRDCGEMVHYEVLHGTTEEEEFNIENGWDGSSFFG